MQNQKKIFFLFGLPFVGGLLVWVIYGQGAQAPFIFDDYLTIVENPAIKSLNNLPWIWKIDPSRFLTYFSFAVNFAVGGLQTSGYHVVNFILHALNGGMLFVFLRLILPGLLKHGASIRDINLTAALITLLFLCHPVQTQAVIYTSERSTLFEVFFYLGTLICYIQSVLKNHKGFYGAAICLALIGSLTKPNFITLPFALILCEIFLFDLTWSRFKKRIPRLLPFFLVLLLIPALLVLWKYKAFSIDQIWGITRETTKLTRMEYLLTQFNVVITYFRLLVFPVNQNLDYDFPIAKNFFSYPTGLSFTALIFIFIFAVKIFKRNKAVSFGILWFFITISIESSVFPISDVIFEHRLYLPMVGMMLAACIFLRRLIRFENYFIIVMAGVIAVLTVMSFQRVVVWKSRIGMLSDIAKKSPQKPRAHNNLASAFHDANRLQEAEEEYRKAIALDPKYAHPRNNLSNIYWLRGETQKAIEELKEAIRLDPDYEAPHYNLGNIYIQQGDLKNAEENYRKALALKPSLALGYLGLGNLSLKKADTASARFYFSEALRLDPNLGYAHYGLGDIYLNEEMFDLAFEEYRKAAEKNPTIISAYNNMGNILDMFGKRKEAVMIYQKAINVDPSYANAYLNLANTLRKMGRFEESAKYLKTAKNLYRRQKNKPMNDVAQQRLQSLLR